MRRESSEAVAAAARRRLEHLARDLGRDLPPVVSGAPADPEPTTSAAPTGEVSEGRVQPVVLAAPGRHARSRGAGQVTRLGNGIGGWVRDRVPPFGLRPAHLPLLLTLCLIVLLGAGWMALRGTPESVPIARTGAGTTVTPSTDQPAPTAPPSPGSVVPTGWVVVDVAGKVRRPGVATLPAGSRVVDAVRRAGGARRGVDLSSINLARVLVDGEQILVGVAPVPGPAAAGSTKPGAADGPVVNLNTADLAALDSLPGVGPVTAQKILDWRAEHGSFSAVDELLEVDGIGARTLDELAPHVTL